MKRIVVGLLAVCLLGSLTVLAEAPKKEAALQDITAMGKLAKLGTSFTVKEADGTVVKVMAPKAVKGEEAPAVTLEALEKLVGKDVKVVGMGTTKTIKDKTTKTIKTVTSIEEAAAPAAPAAAAPAEAPAAPAAAPEAK